MADWADYQTFPKTGSSLSTDYSMDLGFGEGSGGGSNFFTADNAIKGTDLAAQPPSLAGGDTPFFNGGSVVGNIGQGLNLVGSGVSLVGMLQGMRDARKNHKLNRRNINQQMEQSATAFNRDVARQDRSIQGAKERNERVAQLNQ